MWYDSFYSIYQICTNMYLYFITLSIVLLLPYFYSWRHGVPCMWQALPISMPRHFQVCAAFQEGLDRGRPRALDSIEQPQRGTTRSLPTGLSSWAPSCMAQNIFDPYSSFIASSTILLGIQNWIQDKSEQRAAKQKKRSLSSNPHSHTNCSPPIQQIFVHHPPTN